MEAGEVDTQKWVSCSCEPMKHSTWLLEEARKQVLFRKAVKCFSLQPLVKITKARMAATDTVVAERELVAVAIREETEALMAPMVECMTAASIKGGGDPDLTWER